MDVASAMKYFRKTPNKAVITGGYRNNIKIAALETSTKCLILTGDENPGEVVVGKAMMARNPILLVRGYTFFAVEKVESLLGKIHFKGEKRLRGRRICLQPIFITAFFTENSVCRSSNWDL